MSKLVAGAIYGLIALAALGAVIWLLWPMLHKDIGKDTITTTNAIVTNQAVATNTAVERKATNAARAIVQTEQRASTGAARVRIDRSGDPTAYNHWLDELCANDIYEGYADCAGHRGQPGSKGSR